MEKRQFQPGDIVKHFKRELVNDKTSNEYLYEIVGTARHTETKEEFMIYVPLYETDCAKGVDAVVRPIDMFYSEVDHIKYPNIKQKYRFEIYNKGEEA